MCMQITRKHKILPKKGWKPRKIAHFWDAMSILSGLAWNVAKNLGPNILARPNFRPNTLNLFINLAQHFRPSLKCPQQIRPKHYRVIIRACCREANFSKSLAWVFFWCLFMIRIGLKNFKTLSLILHDWKLVLKRILIGALEVQFFGSQRWALLAKVPVFGPS